MEAIDYNQISSKYPKVFTKNGSINISDSHKEILKLAFMCGFDMSKDGNIMLTSGWRETGSHGAGNALDFAGDLKIMFSFYQAIVNYIESHPGSNYGILLGFKDPEIPNLSQDVYRANRHLHVTFKDSNTSNKFGFERIYSSTYKALIKDSNYNNNLIHFPDGKTLPIKDITYSQFFPSYTNKNKEYEYMLNLAAKDFNGEVTNTFSYSSLPASTVSDFKIENESNNPSRLVLTKKSINTLFSKGMLSSNE